MRGLRDGSLTDCQSIFRLRCLSQKASESKPGKQFVTFLLIANVSLFFFHTLEGMKSVFGDAAFSKRTKPYTVLVSAVAPLTVFYRFHSSVCLAEIWKHCYSIKNIMSSTTPTSDSNYDSRSNIHPTHYYDNRSNTEMRNTVPVLPLTMPPRRRS